MYKKNKENNIYQTYRRLRHILFMARDHGYCSNGPDTGSGALAAAKDKAFSDACLFDRHNFLNNERVRRAWDRAFHSGMRIRERARMGYIHPLFADFGI